MSSPVSWRAPEHAPATSSNLRRSFTLPSRPDVRSASTPPAASSSSDGIETLFVCSQSKIVSFTSTSPPRRLSPVRGISPPRSAACWTSPTERTLAVGPLRIYRVTASNVSFLNSGNLLHTIFPRSQCWCVDDQSIFVLRIRQDSYYRIELPFETDEDKETITQFTAALRQVLQYEKTQCPFKRGFKAEAPERPQSPPRKTFKRRPSQTKAKKWILDKTWVPESRPGTANSAFEGSDCGTASSYDDDDRSSVITDSSEALPDHPETVPGRTPPKAVRRPSVAERASIFQGLRSVTAPVGSDRTASAVSMHRIPEESPKKEKAQEDLQKPILERHVSEADSLASSADSFYSLETTNDHNPSTPFLDAEEGLANPWSEEKPRGDESRGRSTHRRQVSEMTVRVPSVQNRQEPNPTTPTAPFHHHATSPSNFQPSSAPSTPPLVSDSDDDSLELPGLDVATPPDAIRMKRLTGASQRRAFSPMPNPKNLFIPPKQPQTLGAQFTQAIVRKTMELVLGPPAHLVSLMLRIAASISNGFGFNTYRIRQTEKPPGSWESEDEEDWPEEDDFGIPLANLGESAQRRQTFSGELD